MERRIERPEGLAGRARSLDGLRGVAAAVVVIHHTFLTYPDLAAAYIGGNPNPAWDWLTYSPLHLVWAGNEAVMVFFLLSGIVLGLPVLRTPRFNWLAYYPSRLVRLYVPVAVSVAIALALFALVPRTSLVSSGPWLAFHAAPPTRATVFADLILVNGVDYLNSPLWSLRFEVLFSLLLPLYVFLARRAGRFWWILALVAVGASAFGAERNDVVLEYLPLFLLGSVIAWNQRSWTAAAAWIGDLRGSRLVWPALFVLALLGLVLRWILPDAHGLWVVCVVELSATVLVLMAIYWGPLRAALETRFVQWLGALSFSLYLVHEPVIVTVAAAMPSAAGWAVPVVGIPLAVGLAWVFSRLVERPAHRLSQSIRRGLDRGRSAVPAKDVEGVRPAGARSMRAGDLPARSESLRRDTISDS